MKTDKFITIIFEQAGQFELKSFFGLFLNINQNRIDFNKKVVEKKFGIFRVQPNNKSIFKVINHN